MASVVGAGIEPQREAASGDRRPVGRVVASVVVVFVAVQVAFFGMLMAAQAVPDRPIAEHVQEAIDDGLYGPVGRPDLMGGRSSAHSECVIAGTGLGRPDDSLFERTIRMPRISSCAHGDEDIARLLSGQPVERVTDYFRYWGGFTVLTRPILAIWGWETLRLVFGGLLAVAAAVAAVAVARGTHVAYAAGLALPMIFASNVLSTPSSSFGLSLSYAAALLGTALTAMGTRRSLAWAAAGAAGGAAIFNYLTQLTTPAVPWMWSAAVAGAVVASGGADVFRTARAVAVVGVAWPVSFAATWASRWAIAVVFVGWDEASSGVRDKIEFRLGGTSRIVDLGLGASTQANLSYWLDTYPFVSTVLGAVLVTVVVAVAIGVRRYGIGRLGLFGALTAPAVVAPLWYEALRNHSQIHAPFVYANLPAALGVVLAAALLVVTPMPRRFVTFVDTTFADLTGRRRRSTSSRAVPDRAAPR